MNRDEYIMSRVKEHYDELVSLGYTVVAVFLQGSQNYCLDEYSDEYMSDVDTKAVVLPTFDKFVAASAPISTTHVRKNDEHIDIKDIRVMFDNFLKQNPSYLELLFTKYKIINPKFKSVIDDLYELRNDISRYNTNQFLRALCGSAHGKYIGMTHDAPHSHDKIIKYGYDPKELHHLVRFLDVAEKYITGKTFDECLIPSDRDYLMSLKKGSLACEDALALGKAVDDKLFNEILKNNVQIPEPVHKEVKEKLYALQLRILKQHLKEELLNSN